MDRNDPLHRERTLTHPEGGGEIAPIEDRRAIDQDTHPVGSHEQSQEQETLAHSIPLVVDLDGTLIETDSLFEGILRLIKQQPQIVMWLPVWILRGRMFLKSEIARRVKLGAESLPYRRELLVYLRLERELGRKIVLATAAHQTVADAVALHTGLFDEVLASQETNLKGARKRDELVRRFGLRGFDYTGDSAADTPIWAASRVAHVAGSRRKVPAAALAAGARQGKRFASPRVGLGTCLRAIRIHQWVKNILIFVPTLAAHKLDWELVATLVTTFFAFSFLASGTYIINDLFDLQSDRKHPKKSHRPFASGALSIPKGIFLSLLLMVAGFGLGTMVGIPLVACLIAYVGLTLTYSWFFKNKPILDVILLALLYTLRVFTGGLVSGSYISPWLFQFSIFLFLSLAFVKRYSELLRLKREEKDDAPGRGYSPLDLNIIGQAGIGAGLMAGLVLALYVNGQEIQRLYPRPYMLWAVCPLFVYWITRVWLIAHRGNMTEDPIIYAFRDKVSYIVGFLILAAAALGIAPSAN